MPGFSWGTVGAHKSCWQAGCLGSMACGAGWIEKRIIAVQSAMRASMLVCGCCFANGMTRRTCAQSLEFKGSPHNQGAPVQGVLAPGNTAPAAHPAFCSCGFHAAAIVLCYYIFVCKRASAKRNQQQMATPAYYSQLCNAKSAISGPFYPCGHACRSTPCAPS